ncbi:MAG: ABC transporter permease, partial [Candidatus Aminicenantes bacterium]|nr:ABC transporter permease [Candidatus Aminicenantes bacterium]
MKRAKIFKAEFKIYRKSGIVKAVLVITFLFAVLFGFLVYQSDSFRGVLSFLSLMRGDKNAFNFSLSLTRSVYNIIIILIIIIVSQAISGEAQRGTLKTVLAKKVKRDDYIVGKSLFFLSFFGTLLGTIYLLSLILGIIFFGFTDISEKNYLIHSRLALSLNYFLSLFLMILPVAASVSYTHL